MRTSNELYEAIKSRITFPDFIKHPEPQINKRGFVPVCNGTVDGSNELTNKSVMVVGQDFGKENDVTKATNNGENIETVSTWKQIRPMLHNLGIEEGQCFFTNYLMGVRTGKSNTGASPGLTNDIYRRDCLSFFDYQVQYIQ